MRLVSIALMSILFVFVCAFAVMGADFSEDFDAHLKADEPAVRGWDIYDEPGANSGPSAWSVKEVDGRNALLQSSNIYVGEAASDSPARGTVATYSGGDWADLTLELEMYATDDDIPGVVFRYTDENNYYVFDMNGQDSRTTGQFGRIGKWVDGQYTEVERVIQPVYSANTWLSIMIEAQGNNIKVYTDGNLLIDLQDDSLQSGTVGVASWGMQTVAFDNIMVDGSMLDNFEDVKVGSPVPGWAIYDEPGASSSPSNWTVAEVGDQIAVLENSNIYGAEETARGSWLYYEGGEWSDAIFEVEMYALDNDICGVLFRYVDENNFYVFDMNGQDTRGDGLFGRLRKCINGEYTDLGMLVEQMFLQDDGIWHRIKVEMLGNNIRVSLDDRELFDVVDTDISFGTIALSTWGMNPGVAFDNVQITDVSSAPVSAEGKLATTWGSLK